MQFSETSEVDCNSLQAGFLSWRLKQQSKKQPQEATDRCKKSNYAVDAAHKQALRQRVLELAHSFIGVPYAKRVHHPPSCSCEGCSQSGRQLGCEPLFLDCCGLVRKIMRRLGLQLGPGNQAYQFDTLPLRVGSVAELEPGDLIFYSGTPLDPGAKRHKFDMMHVEIFVGGATGEATIGSRERYKWVEQYDSYKFDSKRWSLIAHHFCKLDPWLVGTCQPQHPELWTFPANHATTKAHSERDGCRNMARAGSGIGHEGQGQEQQAGRGQQEEQEQQEGLREQEGQQNS